jgi:hypothetical protein
LKKMYVVSGARNVGDVAAAAATFIFSSWAFTARVVGRIAAPTADVALIRFLRDTAVMTLTPLSAGDRPSITVSQIGRPLRKDTKRA